MKDKDLKLISGFLSLGLLLTLLIKLETVPGGMILSGLFLGIMMIIGILLGCLFVTMLLRLLIKKYSFFTLYLITTGIGFLIFHYQLYSPTLKIVVPNNYRGDINLVLSNVKNNILVVDTNGIGYVNQWTFDKTYSKPIVFNSKGVDITDFCLGFNPSAFWGKGSTCCLGGQEINSLSFNIPSKVKLRPDQYGTKDLTRLVNKKLVKFAKPDGHSMTDSASIKK